MELNITMRYVMVQAQRAAAGGPVCVEHIYLAVLSLHEKKVEEIARTLAQEKPVSDDLELVGLFISDEMIDVWPTLCLIRKALAGKLPGDNIPEPDRDVAGLLARVEKFSDGPQIAVADVICSHDKAPTPLLKLCYVDYDVRLTAKEDAEKLGLAVLRQRLGLLPDPVAGLTMADGVGASAGMETVFQPEDGTEPVPEKAPEPE